MRATSRRRTTLADGRPGPRSGIMPALVPMTEARLLAPPVVDELPVDPLVALPVAAPPVVPPPPVDPPPPAVPPPPALAPPPVVAPPMAVAPVLINPDVVLMVAVM